MKLSLNWLNDYVDLSNIPTQELVHKLTMSTCEVDGVEQPWSFLENVVTARVIKKEKHPDADKLSVCQVDAGQKESLQIVCGAPNVQEGMWVALAMVGAKIPLTNGETLKIKPAKLRGVASNGMLCAASELQLEDFCDLENGVMDLEASSFVETNSKTGIPLTKLLPLDDHILDIDNKSITHRPDLWCHFGFAREIAALFSLPIIWNPLDDKEQKNISQRENLFLDKDLPIKKINIKDESAISYHGIMLTGVNVVPSPIWMKIRLSSVGQRPINNIVDSSNYVMLENGQPNHAFDATSLKHETIGVIKNEHGINIEKIETLDGQTHKIPKDTVLITDGDSKEAKVVALAGVMGAAGSEVNDTTTDLFLESATFPRELIRRTVSQTQIRTDSSQRFEKGQDPAKALPVLTRLMAIISQTLPQDKLRFSQTASKHTQEPKNSRIEINLEFIQKRLGFPIEKVLVQDILERLHFRFESTKNEFIITAPTFRSQYDVTIPEDIIEELGRIYGYDNIEPQSANIQLSCIVPNRERDLQNKIKLGLANSGLSEVYNYSFCNEEENQHFISSGLLGVELANPVFGDRPFLRMSQIPGLLHHAVTNQDRFSKVDLFEFARVYFKTSKMKDEGDRFNPADLALEEKHIDIVHLVPDTEHKLKGNQKLEQNFLSYQNARILLYKTLLPHVGKIKFETIENGELAFLHPTCCAKIIFGKTTIGYIGLLHPRYQSKYQLKRQALLTHINYNRIYSIYQKERLKTNYVAPSVYQDSNFDLSVLINSDLGSHVPTQIIESLKIKEITEIVYLTSYSGENLPEGKKSISLRMICQDHNGSIPNERLQKILETCVNALKKNDIALR